MRKLTREGCSAAFSPVAASIELTRFPPTPNSDSDQAGLEPRLVQAAGFTGACTTRSGLAKRDADPFLLPRVKIAYRDGVAVEVGELGAVRSRLSRLGS